MSLAAAACEILNAAAPPEKVAKSIETAAAWRAGQISDIGTMSPPDRPARPDRPVLRAPKDMPRRGTGPAARINLLHAIAHIELNAVDLAWDLIARFPTENLPREFYDDWVQVGAEEAKHFGLVTERLAELGATYGDQPAHDGLWEAAMQTSSDLSARLAIAPLVLEARGLDVTPGMIEKLKKAGDEKSAAVLEVIYDDEIGHVAAGRRWFAWCAQRQNAVPRQLFQSLVRQHFKGLLKPPFNAAARTAAGFDANWYEPLSIREN